VAHVVYSTWENEIGDRAATALQPVLQTPACLSHDLKLNGPAGLLLNDRCATADLAAADDIANLELDEITAAQLAVDRHIKQRSIAEAFVFVEIEVNGPDIARFRRVFWADVLSCIPRAPLMNGGVKV
jgi:hypothetical protein